MGNRDPFALKVPKKFDVPEDSTRNKIYRQLPLANPLIILPHNYKYPTLTFFLARAQWLIRSLYMFILIRVSTAKGSTHMITQLMLH